ncbi:glycosyltransferase family 4 protein [Flavobacterium sp. SUN052]|uniref:glycosyltransferase family 4 protein n=1 Tax=Flavobacterium sp. SUN052 TaxID=3002441 RepID=UPI00237DAB5D|nr:glycosyltransferase family 4 protein [Flavobacterium sp. SUN052]MEC4004396.1 glycosyltransferase family 4 protein [Flavobacterium sp. SUN052]
MKIAFLTIEYPHAKTESAGGIGTSIFNLSKGLIALGHEVVILVYGQYTDEVICENNLTIYKITNVALKGFSFFLTQLKLKKIINKLYAENKIDIIEAHEWTGIGAFIQVRCPFVIKLHGSDTYFCHLENRKVKWSNEFYEKRALQQCNGILSVSKYTAEVTNEIFNLKRDFTVIPNAIDVANFEPFEQKKNNIILYFGTLIRKKGLLELPHIFNKVYAENNNAKLVLVGKDAADIMTRTSSVWQMMQPLFNEEAFKNVSYLGAVPYSEMKKQIEKATVCIFPTFAEALPVSWLEAMAMQKAVVASSVGWAPEIIEDGKDGYLVFPKEHQLYADRILELLKNQELAKQFGNAGRQKMITNFSMEVVAQKSVDYYSKFI